MSPQVVYSSRPILGIPHLQLRFFSSSTALHLAAPRHEGFPRFKCFFLFLLIRQQDTARYFDFAVYIPLLLNAFQEADHSVTKPLL